MKSGLCLQYGAVTENVNSSCVRGKVKCANSKAKFVGLDGLYTHHSTDYIAPNIHLKFKSLSEQQPHEVIWPEFEVMVPFRCPLRLWYRCCSVTNVPRASCTTNSGFSGAILTPELTPRTEWGDWNQQKDLGWEEAREIADGEVIY